MAETSLNNARVRVLPLSLSMRALLGDLLTTIDRRLFALSEAELWAEQEGDHDLAPATCDACCGTGILLVEQDPNEPRKGKETAHGRAGGSQPAYPSAVGPPSSGLSGSTSGASTPGAPVLGPTSLPSITSSTPSVRRGSATSTVIPSATTSSSTAPLPITSTAPPPITSSTVPTTVVSTVGPPVAPSSSAVVAPPANNSFTIPAPSVVIPGFHSLGENHPVPDPQDAVFCTEADGPPFYAVTRGKRVGCFGGWDMVSPYVVKAGGVAYAKKPSLVAAYDVYAKAHARGAVSYT